MTIMRKDSEYGGELEISIDSVEQGILKYEVNDISADKYYKITISDTGVGINQDYLDSIFDPFLQLNPILSAAVWGCQWYII